MILCCRYTMTKSTSVIFILMFALLFGLEQWVGSNRSYCIMSKKLIALFKVNNNNNNNNTLFHPKYTRKVKSYDRILVFKDPSVLWGEDYIITSTQHYFFFSKNPTFYMINHHPPCPPPPPPAIKTINLSLKLDGCGTGPYRRSFTAYLLWGKENTISCF